MLRNVLEDDGGQDLVEYGLLVAALVVGTIALFPAILTAMQTAWNGWGDSVYGLWEPLAPGAS